MKQLITNRQGKQLAVYTDGLKDAPALVLSNSLGTDHGMWQPQVDELKSHFNVITYTHVVMAKVMLSLKHLYKI